MCGHATGPLTLPASPSPGFACTCHLFHRKASIAASSSTLSPVVDRRKASDSYSPPHRYPLLRPCVSFVPACMGKCRLGGFGEVREVSVLPQRLETVSMCALWYDSAGYLAAATPVRPAREISLQRSYACVYRPCVPGGALQGRKRRWPRVAAC